MSLNSAISTAGMKLCGKSAQLVLTETSQPVDQGRSSVRYEVTGVSVLVDATRVVVQCDTDSAPQLPPVVAFKLDSVKFSSLEIPMTNILKVQLTQPWFGPNSVDVSFVAIPKAERGLHLVPGIRRDGTTWRADLYFREGGAIEFQKELAEKHTAFRERVQRQVTGEREVESDLPQYEAPPGYTE
ncbi:hypothetical protein CJU90_5329 [Yarrowia sp. C11]|nr:hypothetical protein CJU90_5329 [Yarrowia sp. C11]KAG5363931.1 hypothetical protein CKK34_2707 [Yarrowia sp. E02]